MIFRSSYFIVRRMLRDYVGMTILILTPIALISVLALLAGGVISESRGIPIRDEISVTMVFAFLMFSGFYTMEYVKGDLMSSMRWRMYSLPMEVYQHAYSILISSTLFSVLQSFTVVIFTIFVFGVYWGNLGIVLLILFVVSTVIQFLYITFVLWVNNYKTAERLGIGFGMACLLLSEVWFSFPENKAFQLLSSYSNPFALGQNMIFAAITGENIETALISLGLLIVSFIILALTAVYFGRRKLI
ncbi:ABC transporter permease [Alteribacillus sp. HJP-4]|uniref:ABC transporter permease n=1 Tax=Alteribacillus sp. HJP-4 TaxID=2775394 RepID=UPI0035CCC92A